MNKLVVNINKSSPYYNLQGLVVSDTQNSYYIIWFKLKSPSDIKDREVYIKERPFVTSIVTKKSVKIISKQDLTIPTKDIAINMAQVQATHWTGGHFRPKIPPKQWQRGIIDIPTFYTSISSKLLSYV